jgi:hypothetical protein
MSQAKDPTLFQFSIRAYSQYTHKLELVQSSLEQSIHDSLHLDAPIEKIQIELEEQPTLLEDAQLAVWEGSMSMVLDMAEDTSEADLGMEDQICSTEIKDASGICQDITLQLGSIPHNVEDFDLFDRLRDAARDAIKHVDHTDRPMGWYAYPGGGYRFWNGTDWVGEAIDQPPHQNHPIQ